MTPNIEFLAEEIEFQIPEEKSVCDWLVQIAAKHKFEIHSLSIIFCSDQYLLEMNKKHLNHDYFTDVITFPYHESSHDSVLGDIFISVDRVRDNAVEFEGNFIDELHRVIIHGLLHLIGMEDQDKASKENMRREEGVALALRMF